MRAPPGGVPESAARWRCVSWTSSWLFTLAAASFALLPGPPALALDPRTPLQHYSARTWRVADGLAFNWASAFAQTPDGYLWIPTQYGLDRFDGVRFRAYHSANTPALRVNILTAAAVDRTGTLWIGTWGGGVVTLQGQHFQRHESELTSAKVRVILDTLDDGILVGTANGISRFARGAWSHITPRDGLPGNLVTCLLRDRKGRIWAGTADGGLGRLERGKWTALSEKDGLPGNEIAALLEDRQGRLWVATSNGIGLWDGESWKTVRSGLGRCLLEDREGSIWVGTEDAGLARFAVGRWETLSVSDSRAITSLFEDGEGNIWIATGGNGITRLSDSPFTVLTSREGLRSDSVMSFSREPDGRLLIGTIAGLHVIPDEGGLLSPHPVLAPGERIQCLYRDSLGTVWIGTEGPGLRRLSGNRLEDVPIRARGSPPGGISSILEDGTGCLLLGMGKGISRICGEGFSERTDLPIRDSVTFLARDSSGTLLAGTFGSGLFTVTGREAPVPVEGVGDKVILSHMEDPDGTLWIGTGSTGLHRRRAGRWERLGEDRGLLDNTIIGMVEDGAGSLWLSSKRGLFKVLRREIEAVMDGRKERLTPGQLVSEGLGRGHCFAQTSPKAIRTSDGRLWIATTEGLVIIDPDRERPAQAPPPVHIEEVLVEGRQAVAAAPGEPVVLPGGSRRIEFLFTAPSFRTPEKVRFSYLLEGFDGDWLPAQKERRAQYMNLPPGDYRFRVRAAGVDGKWSPRDATVPISVAPLFWQTRAFYALVAISLVGVGLAAQRVRILRLKHQREVLQGLITDRTRELTEANEALRGAQQRIAQLLESSPGASEGLPVWSRTISEEIARALGAAEITIWEVERGGLVPLWETPRPAPDLPEIEKAIVSGNPKALLPTPAGLVVPLLGISGELAGALSLHGRALKWGDIEQQLVLSFAHQIGSALEMARLRRKLAKAEERRALTRREMQERGVATLQICPSCGRCFDHTASACDVDNSPLEAPRPLPYRLLERYRFVSVLGQGGMGVVLEAQDEKLDRPVAIKLVRPEHFGQHEVRERFEREARMIARIQHPGVIALLDSGELPDGTAFLVMEKLSGHNLATLIKTFGPGAPRQVAALLRQTSAALSAAHRAGVVHRDVKPENVFLISDPSGFRAKLLDFGLAKSMAVEKGLTQSGMVVGTPQYMSPEQVRGLAVDARSDLYSLAAVCYEALTGHEVVSAGQIGDILVGVLIERPRPASSYLPEASSGVDVLFEAALAKAPSARPASIESWASALAGELETITLGREGGWPVTDTFFFESGSRKSNAPSTRVFEI